MRIVFNAVVMACLALAAAATPGLAQAQAGYLHAVEGQVTVRLPGGKVVQARPGVEFPSGTRFEVGPKASAMLKFSDGLIVLLDDNTNLQLGQYVFNPGNPGAGSAALSLERGSMRFISGVLAVARPEAVLVSAGAAQLSIRSRGADFVVTVDERSREAGSTAVLSGQVVVNAKSSGVQGVAQDQFTSWAPDQVIRAALPQQAAPSVLQATVTELRAAILPPSGPVRVASAAAAAALLAQAQDAQAAANAAPGDAQLRAAALALELKAKLAAQVAAAESAKLAVALIDVLPPPAAGPEDSTQVASTVPAVTPPVSGCVGSPC